MRLFYEEINGSTAHVQTMQHQGLNANTTVVKRTDRNNSEVGEPCQGEGQEVSLGGEDELVHVHNQVRRMCKQQVQVLKCF